MAKSFANVHGGSGQSVQFNEGVTMGGWGSGRWQTGRRETDPQYRLDINYISRSGLLKVSGAAYVMVNWERGGQPSGSIAVWHDGARPDAVVLAYTVNAGGEAAQRIEETVRLDRTPCRFGGSRPWFRCPGCMKRVGVLWGVGARYRCRECHNLAYSSTRESPLDRQQRRVRKLHRRIGSRDLGPFTMPAPKPPRMHRRTYRRIISTILEEELAWERQYERDLALLLGRLGAIAGDDRQNAPTRR